MDRSSERTMMIDRALNETLRPHAVERQALRDMDAELAQAQADVEALRAELDAAWAAIPGVPGGSSPDGQPMDLPETTLAEEIGLLVKAKAELDGLRSWKRSVDEALNSGDGAYRP